MFGRRTSDLSSAMSLSPKGPDDSGAGAAPHFGRRKNDRPAPFLQAPRPAAAEPLAAITQATPAAAPKAAADRPRDRIEAVKEKILPQLLTRIDVTAASPLSRDEMKGPIAGIVAEILADDGYLLTA